MSLSVSKAKTGVSSNNFIPFEANFAPRLCLLVIFVALFIDLALVTFTLPQVPQPRKTLPISRLVAGIAAFSPLPLAWCLIFHRHLS